MSDDRPSHLTAQTDPRPDQKWGETRKAPGVYDPQALRETGELVPVEGPEDKRAREVAALQTEGQIEDTLRANAVDALKAQTELLERARDVDKSDVPSALRAVTDVSSKNIADLFKLTGRDRNPQEGMVDMLSAMASRGYLKLNVELGTPPADAEASADESDP